MNNNKNTRSANRLGWFSSSSFTGAAARFFGRRRRITPAVAVLAGVVFTAQPSAHAALMAYEGFNYSTGSGNLTGQAGGFGWNGSWQTVNNGSSSVQSVGLTAGGNAPSGYDSHSAGNSAFTPSGTRTGRWFDESPGGFFGSNGYLNGNGNIGADGKTIYISFLQQVSGTASYYEFELHRGNLGDPGRMAGVGNDVGDADVHFRIESPAGGSSSFADLGAGNTSVNFYVVRIDFNLAGGNSTVTIYRDSTSATEPGSSTAQITGITADMSFDGISFGAFNNGITIAHDEVRVGQTWADVTSPGATSAGNWTGGGANNYWSSAGNWDNNVVPVFATSLTFAGDTRLNNTNDLTGISANNITFDSAAGAFTLAGNSLGLNGNIGFNGSPSSPISQTISLSLTPSTDISINTPNNGNLAIGGNVTSGSWLTKTGNGTLTLGGTNTFAALSASGGTNIITGSTVFTGGGGKRFYLADGDFINGCKDTLILQPGASLMVTGNYDDSGVIGRDSGSGTLIQNGGTFSFHMANQSYLFVGASGSTATRSEYDMNGGVLDMNGVTLGVALGANAVVTGLVNQVSGVITNVGNLYFSPFFAQGHGIYNLTGGTIYIGSGGITQFGGSVNELNLGGGTIAASTSWSSALNMNLTGVNGAVKFNPAGNSISLSGVLSGTGGLTVNGAGVLELSGANTYTGDTTVTSGNTLQLDVTGSSSGALRVANGGQLNLNYTGNYVVGSFYTNGVALAIGTYNSGNLPAFISGSYPGNIVVTSGISTGLWTGLGGNSNWSTGGNWDNNATPIFPHAVTFAGSNRLNNNNDLSNITISTLTFDSGAGAFTLDGNAVTLSGSLGFNGNPAASVTQTINFGMTFNSAQTVNLPVNGRLTLGGSIASGNGLIKAGLGTLTLGGATDAFSGLSVNGGTNVITGNVTVTGTGGDRFYVGDVGTVGTMVIQPGASLTVSGSFADSGVIGRDSGSGSIIQNGGTFTFSPGNQNYLFVGASSSAATRAEYDMNGGTFDMSGLTLAVALSANGATLITGIVNQVSGTIKNVFDLDLGAFTFGPGHAIYNMSGGSIYIGSGGITSDSGSYELYLGGGTVSATASWSSALNVRLTGVNGPVTFDTAGQNITLSGILSGPGGLIVTNNGTLELSGANTYSGDTTVSSGTTLQLDTTGSSAGAFRINGGVLNLTYSGNYVVAGLYTNGFALPFGTYNAANLPGFISPGSTGNLVVQGVSTGLWVGNSSTGNWSTPSNWDHNAVPVFPIGLTFAGNAHLNNTNDLTSDIATSLTFDSAAGAFTLNGNVLGLNGEISFNGNPASPMTQTINLPLNVNANLNVDTPANGNLLINGNITNVNNTLYKMGSGTLTLGGNNTLAGYEVDGGTNVITGNTTVTGTGGTRAYVASADTVGGSVGTLVIQPGANFTIDGNFADAYVVGRDGGIGTIVQNGGVFSFNPANQTYLIVGAANDPTTRAEYDMSGGLLDMNGKTLSVGLGVNILITGVVNQVSGVITNCGQLWLDMAFSTGYSIYNLSGGSLYIGSGGMIVQSGGSYQVNLGGGTIGAGASWSSSLNMTLTGINGAATFNPAGNVIFLSGGLSGPGGLNVTGGGTLELSGANTYGGDTTVNAGSILKLDSAGSTSAAFRANGGVFNLNYGGTYHVGSLYTNGVALPGGVYTSVNLPGFITGAGSLTVPATMLPHINPPVITGGNLILAGTGGTAGAGYTVLTTTNLATPLALWITNSTGNFNGSGDFSNAIPVSATTPANFFRLRTP